MNKTKVNKKYKDTLFAHLFGSLEYREEIIRLYNALNGSNYSTESDISIVTIEDAVYLGMHNDTAFLIENESISLWEEQSTYNPNMPLRGMIYLGQEFQKLFGGGKRDLYGPRRIIIPTPKYIVFYVGREDEDNEEMRLSDSYVNPKSGCAEMIAKIININNEENTHLLNACSLLKEYTSLIKRVQYYKDEGNDNAKAVDLAVLDCMDDGVLGQYLRTHREEATDMILTEYDEEQHLKNVAEYNHEEGYNKGIKEGRAEGASQERNKIIKLIMSGMSAEEIAEILGVDKADIENNSGIKD